MDRFRPTAKLPDDITTCIFSARTQLASLRSPTTGWCYLNPARFSAMSLRTAWRGHRSNLVVTLAELWTMFRSAVWFFAIAGACFGPPMGAEGVRLLRSNLQRWQLENSDTWSECFKLSFFNVILPTTSLLTRNFDFFFDWLRFEGSWRLHTWFLPHNLVLVTLPPSL